MKENNDFQEIEKELKEKLRVQYLQGLSTGCMAYIGSILEKIKLYDAISNKTQQDTTELIENIRDFSLRLLNNNEK